MEAYLDTLSNKEVEKVFFVLDLIESQPVVPRKFFKKLESTDGIWEVRVQYANNIFRLLGFFDGEKLVVLSHTFTKKSQKIPKKEINTARQRMREYLLRRNAL
ncbi:type II toxin-antitoxin system RelE/ParE family toxin [Desulfoluna sp.]|uniref:type II toxin-antitoxin system RelE/ParE family toxin n=1 Tax=Desulfoluna sp. TaxID=2045199 RepID=UPI0026243341|nr:type II toxin-antitoxin system RelE/ParE family toxin [Desulfoluna sp.]